MKKWSNLFTLISNILILFGCGEDQTPTSNDQIEEQKLDGSISGYVFSSLDSAGLEGISITTSPGGYTTESDFAGYFTIPKMEEGTYTIQFEGGVTYSDSIVRDVELLEDQDLEGIEVYLSKDLDDDVLDTIVNVADSIADSTVNAAKTRDIVGQVLIPYEDLSQLQSVFIVSFDSLGNLIDSTQVIKCINQFNELVGVYLGIVNAQDKVDRKVN